MSMQSYECGLTQLAAAAGQKRGRNVEETKGLGSSAKKIKVEQVLKAVVPKPVVLKAVVPKPVVLKHVVPKPMVLKHVVPKPMVPKPVAEAKENQVVVDVVETSAAPASPPPLVTHKAETITPTRPVASYPGGGQLVVSETKATMRRRIFTLEAETAALKQDVARLQNTLDIQNRISRDLLDREDFLTRTFGSIWAPHVKEFLNQLSPKLRSFRDAKHIRQKWAQHIKVAHPTKTQMKQGMNEIFKGVLVLVIKEGNFAYHIIRSS